MGRAANSFDLQYLPPAGTPTSQKGNAPREGRDTFLLFPFSAVLPTLAAGNAIRPVDCRSEWLNPGRPRKVEKTHDLEG